MADFGCHCAGEMAFGESYGRPYSARLLQKGSEPVLLFRFGVTSSAKKAAALLKDEGLAHTRWLHSQEGDIYLLEALYTPPSDFYAKAGVHSLLSAAVASMQAQVLAVPTTCPLCGLPGCDGYAFLNDVYRPVHMACLKTRLAMPPEDHALPRTVRGNVFTGILGAICGAFFASLPIWNLALNRGEIFWVLYVFIPFLSTLCYRLFRGKANANIGGLAVLGSSLGAALVLEQIWYWLVLRDNYPDAFISFQESIAHYFSHITFIAAVQDMLFCLIALVIGFAVSMILLRRYAHEGVEPARTIRGSKYINQTATTMASYQKPEEEEPAAAEDTRADEASSEKETGTPPDEEF